MKKKFIKIIATIIFVIAILPNVIFANEEDAEKLEIQEIWDEIKQTSADIAKEPLLNSRSAIIFDRTSKTAIFEKNSNEKRAMASTTKIMTAILVLESGKLDDVVEVSQKAANTGGSTLGVKKGDKITLHDLLYGLLLRSRERHCCTNCRIFRRKRRRVC